MFELIATAQISVICCVGLPHFPNDFQPTLSQGSQSRAVSSFRLCAAPCSKSQPTGKTPDSGWPKGGWYTEGICCSGGAGEPDESGHIGNCRAQSPPDIATTVRLETRGL